MYFGIRFTVKGNACFCYEWEPTGNNTGVSSKGSQDITGYNCAQIWLGSLKTMFFYVISSVQTIWETQFWTRKHKITHKTKTWQWVLKNTNMVSQSVLQPLYKYLGSWDLAHWSIVVSFPPQTNWYIHFWVQSTSIPCFTSSMKKWIIRNSHTIKKHGSYDRGLLLTNRNSMIRTFIKTKMHTFPLGETFKWGFKSRW